MSPKTSSLNEIFYGPPGTGKTYETVNAALKILGDDPETMSREEVKQKFAEYQKKNRIFFTTFHQNMAYEDFIEGIKPVEPEEDDDFLKYEVRDGLFMQACVEATFDYIRANLEEKEAVEKLLDFNDLFDDLVEKVSDAGSLTLKTKSGGEVSVTVTSYGNFSVKHFDGEKLYTVSRNRLAKLYEAYPDPEKVKNINRDFSRIIGGSNATAYWSVLNAINNLKKLKEKNLDQGGKKDSELSYEDKRKIVQEYWAKKEYKILEKDNAQSYVFIIDEINRGNVAQIFGELITLIEEDKRMGRKETIYAELPYSKSSFAVPPNLYLIGTMNTADRSVEALDTALRRRFSFRYFGPEPDKLDQQIGEINLADLLRIMNERIEILKDKDHSIGHAWFMEVESFEDLRSVFANKILPLLQEYFYNDYEKLGLVLGDAFFESSQPIKSGVFASFSGGDELAGQYSRTYLYRLKPIKDLKEKDFLALMGREATEISNEKQ